MSFFHTAPAKPATALCLAATLLVASCATPPGSPKGCDTGSTAGLGALVGAVIGAAAGHERDKSDARQADRRAMAQGAAVGAVAGGALGAFACMAVNAQSRQTASAEEVDREARRRAGGMPPQQPTVVAYRTQVQPTTAVPLGSQLSVQSAVEVANGSKEAVADLHESLVLVDPEGAQYPLAEKAMGASTTKAGRYENTFTFTIPPNVSPGGYRALTRLRVNGRNAGQQEQPIRVVAASS
jgi:hypothetical protein